MTHDPRQPADPRRNWPVLIGAALVAFVGLCLFGAALGNFADRTAAGEDTSATAPATAEPARFDQAPGTVLLVTDDLGDTQDAVVFSFRRHKSGCGRSRPGHGTYLVADVLVRQTKGTGAVGPSRFTFVAENGTTAEPLTGARPPCVTNPLGATNALRPGSRRAGQLVFDVASAKGSLEYSPDGPGGAAAGSWTAA